MYQCQARYQSGIWHQRSLTLCQEIRSPDVRTQSTSPYSSSPTRGEPQTIFHAQGYQHQIAAPGMQALRLLPGREGFVALCPQRHAHPCEDPDRRNWLWTLGTCRSVAVGATAELPIECTHYSRERGARELKTYFELPRRSRYRKLLDLRPSPILMLSVKTVGVFEEYGNCLTSANPVRTLYQRLAVMSSTSYTTIVTSPNPPPNQAGAPLTLSLPSFGPERTRQQQSHSKVCFGNAGIHDPVHC